MPAKVKIPAGDKITISHGKLPSRTTPSSPSSVTYDFARLMEGATEVKCSAFGTAIIESMAAL